MGTCPSCGVSSRNDKTFTIDTAFAARPLVSIAGAQMKVVAREVLRLTHESCGWSVLGYVEKGDFVFQSPDAT